MKKIAASFLKDIEATLKEIDDNSLAPFCEALDSADRIFVAGGGRCRPIAEYFAMRLAQLGLTVYTVSSPTTPAITKNDILVLLSPAADNKRLSAIAKKCYQTGAAISVISSAASSPVADLAKHVVVIPKNPMPRVKGSPVLFEQTAFILTDAITHIISLRRGTTSQSSLNFINNLE